MASRENIKDVLYVLWVFVALADVSDVHPFIPASIAIS